jgi:hypothetical protein
MSSFAIKHPFFILMLCLMGDRRGCYHSRANARRSVSGN